MVSGDFPTCFVGGVLFFHRAVGIGVMLRMWCGRFTAWCHHLQVDCLWFCPGGFSGHHRWSVLVTSHRFLRFFWNEKGDPNCFDHTYMISYHMECVFVPSEKMWNFYYWQGAPGAWIGHVPTKETYPSLVIWILDAESTYLHFCFSGNCIRLSQEPARRYILTFNTVQFSQSAAWSKLSFRFPHENEHRLLYMVLHAALVVSLDCAWIVESVDLLSWLISLFSVTIEGLHLLRQRGHFYIYIQAWLLFQGVQFSTDHWDDPFLSSVCVSVYMSPSSPLSDSLTVCLSVLRPSVCLFCVYVILPKIEVFWNICVPCARSALFFALAQAHAKNPDPFCKFPWRLVWRKTECQLSWEVMRVSSRTAMLAP